MSSSVCCPASSGPAKGQSRIGCSALGFLTLPACALWLAEVRSLLALSSASVEIVSRRRVRRRKRPGAAGDAPSTPINNVDANDVPALSFIPCHHQRAASFDRMCEPGGIALRAIERRLAPSCGCSTCASRIICMQDYSGIVGITARSPPGGMGIQDQVNSRFHPCGRHTPACIALRFVGPL